MHNPSAFSVVFLLCLVLCGCAAQGPVPEDHFYQLAHYPAQHRFSSPVLQGTLAVQRFRADGLRSGRALLHGGDSGNAELQQYHYQFWVDPPTRMLPAHLVRYLRSANLAQVISETDSRLAPDYVLSGRIRHFEQTQLPGGQGINVHLEILLRHEASGKVMLLRDYSKQIVLRTTAVADTAIAFSTALQDIYAAILSDLSKP